MHTHAIRVAEAWPIFGIVLVCLAVTWSLRKDPCLQKDFHTIASRDHQCWNLQTVCTDSMYRVWLHGKQTRTGSHNLMQPLIYPYTTSRNPSSYTWMAKNHYLYYKVILYSATSLHLTDSLCILLPTWLTPTAKYNFHAYQSPACLCACFSSPGTSKARLELRKTEMQLALHNLLKLQFWLAINTCITSLLWIHACTNTPPQAEMHLEVIKLLASK